MARTRVLPTATLIPAGPEVTRWPLRPVAVTVTVAFVYQLGVTVRPAVLATPAYQADRHGGGRGDRSDVAVNVALVAPAGTVTPVGTDAAVLLLLERLTTAPPAGTAALSAIVPVELPPAVTLDGFIVTDASVGAPGAGATVSVVITHVPLNRAVRLT